MTMKKGMLVSVAKKPEETTVYEMYYDHEEPVSKVAGHRVLAINRGEKEKIPYGENFCTGRRYSPLSGKTGN